MNKGEEDFFWDKILDSDNFELKPNFAGLRINLNEIINKFKQD